MRAILPDYIKSLIDQPLVDLGSRIDARFSGVFAPAAQLGVATTGVTRQFLEDAQKYHEMYFDTAYSKWLIEGAVGATKLHGEPKLILDVGSGSGPSALALLDMFASSYVVATDVSPQLLSLLRTALDEKGKAANCSTLCLDLNLPWFKGQSFDLAIGCAILHHLFEPGRLVKQVFATLRPGGVLAFFEPFEPGYAALAAVYRLLLAQAKNEGGLPDSIDAFFRGKILEVAARKCEPKDEALYAQIDDKWMFTRSYFVKLGAEMGALETIIYPINDPVHPFTEQIKTDLRLGLGLNVDALPQWAWEIAQSFEASLSAACKNDFIFEGCIAFLK
jgi:ubiquinone/menaquinone biosynthesis C-methylase UbiE